MQTLQSAFGLIALLAPAWLPSEDRAAIPWRLVASGMALALVLAAALLKLPPFAAALASLNGTLDVFENAIKAGATAAIVGVLV